MLQLVTNLSELITNIETLESYLTEGSSYEKTVAASLVKRGTCFVAYRVNDELRFAPSRFTGYKDNKLGQHLASKKDGRETNKAIIKIIKVRPIQDKILEKVYSRYCYSLGITPSEAGSFGAARKFWTITLDGDFKANQELSGDFPEGKLIERLHKARERNSQVIALAKQKFKEKHGTLYCQACGFDFGKTYGSIGQDFIEGHHTLPVYEMPPDYKTKISEIAMLCSNCHKMIHKRRPWLTMKELDKLLNFQNTH